MRLDYNKIYYFRYKAIGEGKLHVYDKTPLIFIVDIRPNSILGVNLHWIPKKDREDFFDSVVAIMDKTKTIGKKHERMRLTYELLKKPKFRVGLQGLRMYYVSGMSYIKEIDEAQWNIVIGQYGKISKYRMRKVYKHKEYKD